MLSGTAHRMFADESSPNFFLMKIFTPFSFAGDGDKMVMEAKFRRNNKNPKIPAEAEH
jgi:hypothetical protein